MTNTIFDLVEADLPEGAEGFMELAQRAPAPKDDSFLNTIKDYGKTALKGSIEGLTRLGRVMGPLQDIHGKQTPQILEEQTQRLEELLPTDEGFGQKALRRGLAMAPSMAAFPGAGSQSLPRSLAAGFAGEGAKELGAPEWAQTAAELTAFIGPDVTKKLLETGRSKDIVAAGRKMGLTDEQITPLMQSEFKQKWLGKFAPKRGSTQKALASTKAALSEGYNTLRESPAAQASLSRSDTENLVNSLSETFEKMPSAVRSKIKQDTRDLMNKPITGETLINYWQDINHNLGSKTKQLSLLKEPLKKALQDISPELAKDFEMLNGLQSKYYPIASKLKPNITDDIVRAAENIGLLGSLVTGYYPHLSVILAEKAGRQVAKQMLINPRFQQIAEKTVSAINQNKFGMVKKLADLYAHELRDIDPKASDMLKSLSEEEIREFFSHQGSEEE